MGGADDKMMMEFTLNTERENFYNITRQVKEAVRKSGITDGLCTVFWPAYDSRITINEKADPERYPRYAAWA